MRERVASAVPPCRDSLFVKSYFETDEHRQLAAKAIHIASLSFDNHLSGQRGIAQRKGLPKQPIVSTANSCNQVQDFGAYFAVNLPANTHDHVIAPEAIEGVMVTVPVATS